MSGPVVVVYDILDDHRRARVRSVLDPLAIRFQQSGWLVPAGSRTTPRALAERLTAITTRVDRVRLLAPCPRCAAQSRWWPGGQPHGMRPFLGWVVT
ncbi:CRISPR-associated endonuclease Cas2 [Actinokineospora sp. G85]|uniref:CRISPR-associated endonuclease Cas2 n=1 Tax=Actinokineospora sp. G85 TaxID=3406626 RepID=UPI003C759B0C